MLDLRFSMVEIITAISVAFLIGGLIGIQNGWDQACAYASVEHQMVAQGKVWVSMPGKAKVDDVVYGSGWLKERVCENR